MVHFADIMVRGYGDGGDPWVPELDRGALQLLAPSPQKLAKMVDGICQKLADAGGVPTATWKANNANLARPRRNS